MRKILFAVVTIVISTQMSTVLAATWTSAANITVIQAGEYGEIFIQTSSMSNA